MRYVDFTELSKRIAGETTDPQAIIAARNKAEEQAFPLAVEQVGWHLVKPHDSFDLRKLKNAIVVIVAIWSTKDMVVLNNLVEKLNGANIDVFIFDIDAYPTGEQLLNFIPSIAPPRRTPVLIKYSNGQIEKYLEGNRAYEWITEPVKKFHGMKQALSKRKFDKPTPKKDC